MILIGPGQDIVSIMDLNICCIDTYIMFVSTMVFVFACVSRTAMKTGTTI